MIKNLKNKLTNNPIKCGVLATATTFVATTSLPFALNLSDTAKTVGTWIIAGIVLMMVWRLFVNAKEYAKGQGSGTVAKIISDILVALILIGFAYALNSGTLNKTAQDLGEKAGNSVESLINEATGKAPKATPAPTATPKTKK